jgi:hypothetical protein
MAKQYCPSSSTVARQSKPWKIWIKAAPERLRGSLAREGEGSAKYG